MFFVNIIVVTYAQSDIKFEQFYNKQYIGGIGPNNRPSYNSSLKKEDATFTVSSAKELLKALSSAKRGDLIYINDKSVINLSHYKDIEIREGITIYGNRGVKGSKGPLLYTNSHGVHPLFNIVGDNVMFFGLRIRGADGTRLYKGVNAFSGKTEKEKKEHYLELYRKNMYATPVSSGIATNNNNLTVENCELYQWTYTSIYLRKGAKNALIRNNYIHHNQRFGLGYGVTIDQSEATIEGNLFNYNGHSIASPGREGSSYRAVNNVFKEGFTYSWDIDMHGGQDRGDNTDFAGDYIYVSHNIFYVTGRRQAVVIRGIPRDTCIIKSNIVYKLPGSEIPDDLIFQQVNGKGNFVIENSNVVKSK